jgi:hydrogenase maturation protease
MNRRRVVIGVGNPWRRDDGVGVAVARALQGSVPSDVEVIELAGDLTRAIPVWAEADPAIVIDGIRAFSPPGTVTRLGDDDLLAAGDVGVGPSTHGIGLGEALAIGHAVGVTPRRLIVFGVEMADTGHGNRLSPHVENAVPEVTAEVIALLA